MLWFSGRLNRTKVNQPALLALAPFSEGEGQTISTRAGSRPLPESKEEINTIYNLLIVTA